jgi:hypothetical protein
MVPDTNRRGSSIACVHYNLNSLGMAMSDFGETSAGTKRMFRVSTAMRKAARRGQTAGNRRRELMGRHPVVARPRRLNDVRTTLRTGNSEL